MVFISGNHRNRSDESAPSRTNRIERSDILRQAELTVLGSVTRIEQCSSFSSPVRQVYMSFKLLDELFIITHEDRLSYLKYLLIGTKVGFRVIPG